MGKERFVDLIQKKKNGETLTKEEIDFMITDYVGILLCLWILQYTLV